MTRMIAFAAALAVFAPVPLAAGPVAVAPAARTFHLGGFEVTALRDALNVVANDGSVFGTNTNPGSVAEVLHRAGAPSARVTLGVDALLVRGGGRVMLFDTGLGPRVHGMLLASLAEAKVAPADVTDVFITHGHADHVGGLLDAAGASAFPKAAIRLSAAEWAWLKGKPDNARLVAAIGGQVAPFQPGGEIVPGVHALAAAGHTPGHIVYAIGGTPAALLDIGDSAHSSIVSLARPDWTIAYDTDKQAGATTRETVLAGAAASHVLVFAPHFPFPGVGHIVGSDGHYRWEPGVPAD